MRIRQVEMLPDELVGRECLVYVTPILAPQRGTIEAVSLDGERLRVRTEGGNRAIFAPSQVVLLPAAE